MNDPNTHNIRAEVLNDILALLDEEIDYWEKEKKYNGGFRRHSYTIGAIAALKNVVTVIQDGSCK